MKNSKQVCLGRGLLATSAVIVVFLVTGGTARAQQTTGVNDGMVDQSRADDLVELGGIL